jgi:hypothetical protein
MGVRLPSILLLISSVIGSMIENAAASAAEFLPTNVEQRSATCALVLRGSIEPSDEIEFQRHLVALLRSGCKTPRLYIYSPGGNLAAAMKIGEQVHFLQLTTIAPTLLALGGVSASEDRDMRPRREGGPRLCEMLPQAKRSDRYGDYDPNSGNGDANCGCASACFFVWAAGLERKGDVIQVHRPYFDPKEFAVLDMTTARSSYEKMLGEAQAFLKKIGVHSTLIDRMFTVDSSKAYYLTPEDLRALRWVPHWAEMKIAKCGPEPKQTDEPPLPPDAAAHEEAKRRFDPTQPLPPGVTPWARVYAQLEPHVRRHLIKVAKREVCWTQAQSDLRQATNAEYLRRFGR